MNGLSPHDICRLLLAVAVLLASAHILGELARRFRQPAIIGELLAGIVLGPTILGRLWPGATAALFPATGPVAISLQALTTLAITLFLMVAGMEVDLSTIWRRKKAALWVGTGGMLVPFVCGFALAWHYREFFGAVPGSPRFVFALFLATALAISALPVIAKILMDLQLFRSDLGMTIVAAAVLADLAGWLIFAMVLALLGQHSGAGLAVWQTMAVTLLFVAVMLTGGRLLIDRSLPWIQAHTSWPSGVLGLALAAGILCAAFTEWIGVHAIFGAFIFGIALGDSRHLRAKTRATIDQFISFIFAPLFFAGIGLRLDLLVHFDFVMVLVLLVVGIVAKVVGGGLAAGLAGFTLREATAIGCGLSARGAMEIILGVLALEAGVIGERLFVALVLLAIVSSMTSGSLMQWVLGRPRVIHFANYLTAKTFVAALRADHSRGAIAELAALAASAGGLDAPTIEEAAWNREQLVSSAIGNGVALPQVRLDGLRQPIVALGISREGLDFDAADGRPTRLIVLLLTPTDQTPLQLGLLSSIARTFRDPQVVERAVECTNWTQFLATLKTSGTLDSAAH